MVFTHNRKPWMVQTSIWGRSVPCPSSPSVPPSGSNLLRMGVRADPTLPCLKSTPMTLANFPRCPQFLAPPEPSPARTPSPHPGSADEARCLTCGAPFENAGTRRVGRQLQVPYPKKDTYFTGLHSQPATHTQSPPPWRSDNRASSPPLRLPPRSDVRSIFARPD